MIVKEEADLDFGVDDFSYVVFVTTEKMKCFGCGKTGHLVRDPNKNNDKVNGINKSSSAESIIAGPASDGPRLQRRRRRRSVSLGLRSLDRPQQSRLTRIRAKTQHHTPTVNS